MSDYSKKDFEAILRDVIEDLTYKKENDKKVAYLLGGQPGSGKTVIQKLIKEKDPNAIIIDNDSFKRLHPNFEQLAERLGLDVFQATAPFSNEITESLVSQLSDKGYTLVIEGTLRTAEVPLKTAKELIAKGYDVSLYVMGTPFPLSYLGTIERYEEQFLREPGKARLTPRENQITTFKALPKNLEILQKSKIFKEIAIYNREATCLYSTLNSSGSQNISSIYKNVLEAPIDPLKELKTINSILELMKANKHEATKQYKWLSDRKQELDQGSIPLKNHMIQDSLETITKENKMVIDPKLEQERKL